MAIAMDGTAKDYFSKVVVGRTGDGGAGTERCSAMPATRGAIAVPASASVS